MNVRLKFLGGAKSVTGSKYLLEIDSAKTSYKLMLDCGLFQGLKDLRLKNWEEFPINPKNIDAVVISHCHIDHTGYLPRIYKEGYKGKVYCTQATKDLMEIMLLDSAKLQEEEAEYAFKKGYSKHEKPAPLYTVEDVNDMLPMLDGYGYKETIQISPQISIKYHDAGHVLGSAIVEIVIKGDSQTKKLVFSGDLGRYNKPILRNPSAISSADILMVESTYGNKENPADNPKKRLGEVVNEAFEKQGCLLVPAFSVGRTQTLIYYFKQLIEEKIIPSVPIFIDSPMGISATGIYKRNKTFHTMQDEAIAIFDFQNIRYFRSQQDSISINNIKKNAIIISSSGMCNGGRILHHLYNRLPKANDTLLFVGYQSEGTRGRKILDGEPTTKIFGEEVQVKCNIVHLDGLSAHADKKELFKWLKNFKSAPKQTFIVHGEVETMGIFAQNIRNQFGWNVTVPDYMESFELFKGI
ncbi:MAG: MBL fold metallo-hydrolase [Bacteroidetes bacterium]|nr:MAG: MBL fold metallo-hydrolase [Bacteroidota bacterium]